MTDSMVIMELISRNLEMKEISINILRSIQGHLTISFKTKIPNSFFKTIFFKNNDKGFQGMDQVLDNESFGDHSSNSEESQDENNMVKSSQKYSRNLIAPPT